jgi:capsid protein
VFREWLDLAVLAGELPFDDYDSRPERYDTPRWMARGWDWVDPLKEAKAYRQMEQAGYMTKAQIVAKLGGDFFDNLTEFSREQQAAEELSVELDRDIIDELPEEVE